MLKIPVPERQFTPEEYEIVQDRVEVKLEMIRGQIVPKEGKGPLPVEIVEKILSSNFNLRNFHYEFPMATSLHSRIIQNLNYALIGVLDRDQFEVYSQDPQIYISLTGNYRIPDITVAPNYEKHIYRDNKLVNPIIVMEVLSPSNSGDGFLTKIQEYKTIESLREYWFVAQDVPLLERFVRHEQGWLTATFDEHDEEANFPTLDISIPLKAIYKGIFEEG
ncbi:MAG: Uma2 family endonuclease [Bacteroidota bacterium]